MVRCGSGVTAAPFRRPNLASEIVNARRSADARRSLVERRDGRSAWDTCTVVSEPSDQSASAMALCRACRPGELVRYGDPSPLMEFYRSSEAAHALRARSAAPEGLELVVRARRFGRSICSGEEWRPGRDSNPSTRICSPLRSLSATRPTDVS